MVTLLLATHVILLSLSLFTTIGTVFVAVLGRAVPKQITALNVTGTVIGLVCGVVLLLDAPLDAKCLTLAAYLFAFVGAQVYVSSRNQRLAVSSET